MRSRTRLKRGENVPGKWQGKKIERCKARLHCKVRAEKDFCFKCVGEGLRSNHGRKRGTGKHHVKKKKRCALRAREGKSVMLDDSDHPGVKRAHDQGKDQILLPLKKEEKSEEPPSPGREGNRCRESLRGGELAYPRPLRRRRALHTRGYGRFLRVRREPSKASTSDSQEGDRLRRGAECARKEISISKRRVEQGEVGSEKSVRKKHLPRRSKRKRCYFC